MYIQLTYTDHGIEFKHMLPIVVGKFLAAESMFRVNILSDFGEVVLKCFLDGCITFQ